MSSFQYDPPIGKTNGTLQTIRLMEGRQTIGSARWHAAADDDDGIVQILEFQIEPAHGRQGHGRRLMAALVEQCHAYHRLHGTPLRRIWMTLHHERHILARAFFLSQGFTHTTSIRDVARFEELLVYVRSFD